MMNTDSIRYNKSDAEENTMILQDKVALITGGTSGIGRATAIAKKAI